MISGFHKLPLLVRLAFPLLCLLCLFSFSIFQLTELLMPWLFYDSKNPAQDTDFKKEFTLCPLIQGHSGEGASPFLMWASLGAAFSSSDLTLPSVLLRMSSLLPPFTPCSPLGTVNLAEATLPGVTFALLTWAQAVGCGASRLALLASLARPGPQTWGQGQSKLCSRHLTLCWTASPQIHIRVLTPVP